jgi:hypothetical protein
MTRAKSSKPIYDICTICLSARQRDACGRNEVDHELPRQLACLILQAAGRSGL